MQQGARLSGGGRLRLGETPQTWGDSVRASTVCAQEAAVNVGLRRGNSSQLYFPLEGKRGELFCDEESRPLVKPRKGFHTGGVRTGPWHSQDTPLILGTPGASSQRPGHAMGFTGTRLISSV